MKFGRCEERPDDGGETTHCTHEVYSGHEVCCWCGDLFIGDDEPDHGEYKPYFTANEPSPNDPSRG